MKRPCNSPSRVQRAGDGLKLYSPMKKSVPLRYSIADIDIFPRIRNLFGFTLIELMITVAIVAILSAVALPSYQSYVKKGKRADARTLLQSASLAQEKHRLNNTTYASDTSSLSPPCPASGACPSEQANYVLATPTLVTGSTYTLTANASSASQLADTDCTAIVYTVTGTKVTYTPAACWGR